MQSEPPSPSCDRSKSMVSSISAAKSSGGRVQPLRFDTSNWLTVDLVFQDDRVMTPAEAKYPELLQSIPLDERQLSLLKQPAAVMHLLDNISPIPAAHRSHLLALDVKTLLVVPLNLAEQLIGSLTFRFTEDREFRA